MEHTHTEKNQPQLEAAPHSLSSIFRVAYDSSPMRPNISLSCKVLLGLTCLYAKRELDICNLERTLRYTPKCSSVICLFPLLTLRRSSKQPEMWLMGTGEHQLNFTTCP